MSLSSGISSNVPFTPAPSSGTQESGISNDKIQKGGSSQEPNVKPQEPLSKNGSVDANSRNASSDNADATSENTTPHVTNHTGGTPSGTPLPSTMNDGGATAAAAYKDQFQQAGSKFVNNTTLSQKATDYVSKTIQTKVSSSSMTLKMGALVTKTAAPAKSALVNENGAPQLPEPAPLVVGSQGAAASPVASKLATTGASNAAMTGTTAQEASGTTPEAAGTAQAAQVANGIAQTAQVAQVASGIAQTAQTAGATAKGVATTTKGVATTAKGATSSAKMATTAATDISSSDVTADVSTAVSTATGSTTSSSDTDPLSTQTGPTDQLNVFAMAAASAEMSTNTQLLSVDASIAGEDCEEENQQVEISNEEYNINQATISKQSSHGGKSAMSIVGWVVNVSMVLAGAVLIATGVGAGLGAALIIGGTLSIIMMTKVGKEITTGLTHMLEGAPFNLSAEDAAIVASVIIAVVIIAASMGGEASGIGEALNMAGKVGKVAFKTSDIVAMQGTEAGVETSTTAGTEAGESGVDSADNSADFTTRDGDVGTDPNDIAWATNATMKIDPNAASTWALSFKRAFQGFGTSLYRSGSTAMSRTAATASGIADAPLTAMSNTVKSAGTSVATIPASIARSAYEFSSIMISSLKGLTQFMTESASSLAGSSWNDAMLSIKEATTMENLMKAGSTAMKALPKDALSATFVTVNVLQSALSMYQAYIQLQAQLAQGKYEKYEGEIQIDEAMINQMQDFIENSNTAINQILSTVTQEIDNTGSVLADMASPLQNLAS